MDKVLEEIEKEFDKEFPGGLIAYGLEVDDRVKLFLRYACKQYAKAVAEEMIGEDQNDKAWSPENQTMDYEDVCDLESRNELRAEQRQKLVEILEAK
jgi:hypothetical protein